MVVRTPSRLSLHKLALIAPLVACLLVGSATAHAGGGGGKADAGAGPAVAEQPAASFSIAMK